MQALAQGSWGHGQQGANSMPPTPGMSQHTAGMGVWLLWIWVASQAPHWTLEKPKSFMPSGMFGQTHTSDHNVPKLLLVECVHQKRVVAECCSVHPLQRQFPRKRCLSKPQVSVQAAKNVPDLSDCIRWQSERTRERKWVSVLCSGLSDSAGRNQISHSFHCLKHLQAQVRDQGKMLCLL